LGVTVLTSLDENDLEKIGIRDTVQDEVLVCRAGPRQWMPGIVTSAREASRLRAELGHDLLSSLPRGPARRPRRSSPRSHRPRSDRCRCKHIVVGTAYHGSADPGGGGAAILAQIG